MTDADRYSLVIGVGQRTPNNRFATQQKNSSCRDAHPDIGHHAIGCHDDKTARSTQGRIYALRICNSTTLQETHTYHISMFANCGGIPFKPRHIPDFPQHGTQRKLKVDCKQQLTVQTVIVLTSMQTFLADWLRQLLQTLCSDADDNLARMYAY